jgi:hypothetical protein
MNRLSSGVFSRLSRGVVAALVTLTLTVPLLAGPLDPGPKEPWAPRWSAPIFRLLRHFKVVVFGDGLTDPKP